MARFSGIEGDFRRIDSSRFTATVYRSGEAITRCTIFMGGGFSSNGISYVDGETTESNGYNENLRVEADVQSMFLRSMGMRSFGSQREEHLTMQGAAEIYWSMFIARLQGDM